MSPTIYTSRYPRLDLPSESLWTSIFHATHHDPSLPAFIEAATGRTLSRAELRNLSLQLAHGIRTCLPEDIRLSRGDTAMIYSPSSYAWPIALLGLVAGGVRSSLATINYTTVELASHYQYTGARVVFSHPALISVVFEMFTHLGVSREEAQRRIVVMDYSEDGIRVARKESVLGMNDLLGHGALPEEEKFDGPQASETVFICYTSGTTGERRAVETTHSNLTSMLRMVHVVYPTLPIPGLGSDVGLCVLPYFYMTGLVMLLLYPLFRGSAVVIMPQFDPAQFYQAIQRYNVTASLIVPSMLPGLIKQLDTTQYELGSLRSLTLGAAPAREEVVNALVSKLKLHGTTIIINQGYGLTEASVGAHALPMLDSFRKMGSIGILLPNLEARVVAHDEKDSTSGNPGELWLRGPTVMKGYWNVPTATADTITAEGWLKTGDIVTKDEEGYYYFVDRKADLIHYKGIIIPPSELERSLLQHPEIVDAGVIGVHDPAESTEVPRAYVVHKNGNAPANFPEAVQQWIKDHVPNHQFLRGGVVVTNDIPRSVVGKLLHKTLRERAKSGL